MSFLMIDESKCKRDGICARECPMAIIRLKKDDEFPTVVPRGEDFCLVCGHCVAVCPNGALEHRDLPLDACPPVKKELIISPDHAEQFLRSRRSIRVFKEQAVEKEKIQRLIESACYAPSGGNAQPVQWLVVSDRVKVRELAGLAVDWMRHVLREASEETLSPYMPIVIKAWDRGIDSVLWNAPALVVASAPEEASNGLVDITLALSYLELAAVPMGLGTCWAGLLQAALLNWEPLQEAVGLPEAHIHHYPMMLGYPKFKYHRLPARKEPKITWK